MEFKLDGIENNPSVINFDQAIDLFYSFAGVAAPKTYYLAGVFQKEVGSNYFGFTWNNNWYKYGDEFTNFYKLEIKESSASGKLKIKPDVDSSGFKGTGDYQIKIYRFCTSQNNCGETNTLSIQIMAPPSPSPSSVASPSPETQVSPSPPPLPSKSPIPSPKVSLPPSPEEVINEAPEPSEEEITQVLGASNKAKPTNPYRVAIVLIGLGLSLIGGSIWGIMKHGKMAKD